MRNEGNMRIRSTTLIQSWNKMFLLI